MAVCRWCGGLMPRNAKPSAKYCSSKCRQASYRARRKQGEPTCGKIGKVVVQVSPQVDASLNRADFDRMMDDSYEDLLRFSRDVLKKALADDETPATAIAGISKQLLSVGKELEDRDDTGLVLDDEDDEVVDDGFRPEIV